MISLRWWHRSFLTSFPLTRTAIISSRTKHHWENPRTWEWAWSTPQDHIDQIRRVSKVPTFHHIVSPSGSVAPPRELSPETQIAQEGKENSEGKTSPHFMGIMGPFLRSPYSDLVPLGIWLWGRGGKGLATTNTWILAEFNMQNPSSSPNQQLCSSAEPSQGLYSHPETWRGADAPD